MGLAERADVIVDFTNVPVGQLRPRQRRPGRAVRRRRAGRGLRRRPTRTPPARSCSSDVVPGGGARSDHAAAVPGAAGDRAAAGGDGHPAAGAPRGDVDGLRRRAGGGAARHRRRRPERRDPACGPSGCGWTPVTENPAVGATEVWEFYNTTADAHPMHVHEVVFEVVNRQDIVVDEDDQRRCRSRPARVPQPPEPWETGFKDTVIAYPGQVTRVRAQFNKAGPVRLALPHRRARGQRDDAAVPHRAGGSERAAAHARRRHVIARSPLVRR